MTALAGLWNFDGNPSADISCARMLQAQAMYGPHGSDRWDGEAVAMGRNLYRTLPEDIHDSQPLIGGGGRFVLVADLRLDNRDELIALLGIAPEKGRFSSDAAILLAAWERWQEVTMDHLAGDYAFAVFDREKRRLVLVRDAVGMRPLCYHHGRGFFAFASMPKGLHALPAIPRAPDDEKIAEHLALLPETSSRSFFKDVERVLPGGMLEVTPDRVQGRRHWEPARKRLDLRTPQDYADALNAHIDRAVRDRLRGAGSAVATHLSSGMDSSAVTVSTAIGMQANGGRVVAFTAVPREGYSGRAPRRRHGDEGPVAAKTAAMYPNIEHVRVSNTAHSPFAGLDRSFRLYEQPVLNLCNSAWYDGINDAAKARGLRVLLLGAMGNMTLSFDGTMLLPDLIGRGRFLRWAREARGILKRRNLAWTGLLATSFSPFLPDALWQRVQSLSGRAASDISDYSAIRPERVRELDIEGRAKERGLDLTYRARRDSVATRLWVLRRVDFGNITKGVLAGWDLDHRDPTTDRRLVEFCLSVPDEQYLRDGETRALGRLALASRVPPEVTRYRTRGYQAIDWHEGLTAARDELREELERLEDNQAADAAIDLARLRRMTENWPQSDVHWNAPRVMGQYRLALLRAVATGHFLRRASGSNR